MSDRVKATFRQPFNQQLAAFRLRMGNLVPTHVWNDMWQSQHDISFMVAGATKADLIADIAAAFEEALREGQSDEKFAQKFFAAADKHGWRGWTGDGTKKGRAWRARIIYQTNLRTTYAAGRMAQLVEGGFAYYIYKHGGSLDPRPHHLAWDGLVLKSSHPFWETHGPPNGWSCSCYITGAHSKKSAVRHGGDLSKSLPEDWNAINPKTGAPHGIDKGWAYSPGRSVARTIAALTPKLTKLPAPIGADWINEWPLRLFPPWSEAFAEFVENVDLAKPQGKSFTVGAMKPQWIRKLQDIGVGPVTGDITVVDKAIAHAFRDVKKNPVSMSWYKRLPEWLRDPDLILLDQRGERPTLLIYLRDGANQNKRVVVHLQYDLKKHGELNYLTTAQIEAEGDIYAQLGGKTIIYQRGNL